MVCMLCFNFLTGLEFTFLCMVMIYDNEFEMNESKILTKVNYKWNTSHMCGRYSTLCSHLIQFEEAGFPKHVQNFLYRIKNDNNINLFFQLEL